MTLREQLKRDEGLSLRPYRCTADKLTIGYGRNLEQKGIAQAEAELMLDNDISEYTAAVLARIPFAHRLDEVRRGALVNLAFNMGIAGLLGFKQMLAAMERGDWHEAARELLDSRYANQVGQRATRLAEQLITGTWQ